MFTHPSVYMIYSRESLGCLSGFLGENELYMRVIRDYKTGRETNKTLCVLPEENYLELAKEYGSSKQDNKFKIVPYEIHDRANKFNLSDLFIPVPNELAHYSDQVMSDIESVLSMLVRANILSSESFTIQPPRFSREDGSIRGGVRIKLNDVSKEAVLFAKTIINGSYWSSSEQGKRYIMQCRWAKNFTSNKSNVDKNPPKPEL